MLGSEDLQVEDPMMPKSGTARLHEVELCEEALRGFGMEKILLQLGPFSSEGLQLLHVKDVGE